MRKLYILRRAWDARGGEHLPQAGGLCATFLQHRCRCGCLAGTSEKVTATNQHFDSRRDAPETIRGAYAMNHVGCIIDAHAARMR